MPDTGRKRLLIARPRSQAGVTGWGAVAFSLPFIAVGAGALALWAGIIPIERKIDAPTPVILGFGGLFLLAGLSVIVHAGCELRRQAGVAAARRQRPAEPWYWDYPWNERGTQDEKKKKVLSSYIGLLAFVVFLVPFNYLVFFFQAHTLPLMPKLVIGLFDVIVVIGFGYTVYLTLQFLKYGTSSLRFGQFPFTLGGKLRAGLAVAKLGTFEKVTATLRHVEEKYEMRGTGKNRSQTTVCYQLWADTMVLEEHDLMARSGPELLLEFPLPAGDYATRLSERPPRYWELEVKGEAPGVDYGAVFLVPVYGES